MNLDASARPGSRIFLSIKDSSFIFENVYFLICLFFKSWGGGVGEVGLALPVPPPARAQVVSKLVELQCHWKVRNRTRRGLTKKLYTIYPPKEITCVL